MHVTVTKILTGSKLMLASRLWQYQRERFPLAAYFILVACFSFAASQLASLLSLNLIFVFLQTICGFAMLRIIDEFKDYQDDLAWRPYRPVPRGLVTLKELSGVALFCLIIQVYLSTVLNNLLPWLIWLGFIFLMSYEFFMGAWLKRHPIIYLLSHMISMPIMAWTLITPFTNDSLAIINFSILAFFAGLLLEVGRKIRLPEEEEEGVETYSALWQRQRAILVWSGILLTASLLVALTESPLRLIPLLLSILLFTFALKPRKAKIIENISAVMLLVLFTAWGLQ